MISPKTAAIENLFPDDVEEIIERVLLRYRPIFSHMLMGSFRNHLQRAIQGSLTLKSWLPVGPRHPVHGTSALTAGQVALLGGTRPVRSSTPWRTTSRSAWTRSASIPRRASSRGP